VQLLDVIHGGDVVVFCSVTVRGDSLSV